jgi:hypothetical protein
MCSQHLILVTLFFFLLDTVQYEHELFLQGPALTSGDKQATCKRITKAQSDRQGYPSSQVSFPEIDIICFAVSAYSCTFNDTSARRSSY